MSHVSCLMSMLVFFFVFFCALLFAVRDHRIEGSAGGGGGHGSRQRLRQNRSHVYRQSPGDMIIPVASYKVLGWIIFLLP